MSMLKQTLHRMICSINVPAKSSFHDMSYIKRVEDMLKEEGGEVGPDKSIDLKSIIKKIEKDIDLSNIERRNIPFVLYKPECENKIFLKAISLIEPNRVSHIKRLLMIFFMNYDNSSKTNILAEKLNKMLLTWKDARNPFIRTVAVSRKNFFGENRLKQIADRIAKKKDVIKVAKEVDFPQTLHGCKFLQESLKSYFQLIDVSVSEKCEMIETIKDNDSYKDVMPVAADNVIPLIEKFRGQEKNRFKSIAIEAFYNAMGDPRIAKGSLYWHDVSESAIRIFRHWIAERDLDLFFKIIEDTAVDSMWSNRKAYWKKYLPMMHNTWVFFGRDAMKYVSGLKNKALAYGELKHGSVDQSVFAFQIENYTFVEFSHNGSLRVWLIDDAPEIFGEESIDAGEIRRDSYPVKGKVPHLGDWQLKVDDWMYKNCHLKK